MRKLTALLLALLLLALTGCGSKNAGSSASDPTDAVDYLSLIRTDLFSEDTTLTQAMSDAVTLTLDSAEESSITVTVTAPNVCADTLAWFDAVSDEDYSDEALTEQMLSLLEGDAQTQQFTLTVEDGAIVYTDDFLDAASCGVREFYTALTVRFMEEMEASIDG